MRVLWVVKGLGPGGAETLLAVAAELHDRDRFDIECAYVLPHKDHLVARLERAGVVTMCVGHGGRDLLWPARLARVVRSGRYDVVHVHSPLPGSVARLATRLMRPRTRPRIVATEHNAWTSFARVTRLLNRLTSRWNDVTFAVSDEARSSVEGAASARATTLVHGIDLDATRAQRDRRDAVRRELGIGLDEFVIGTVANFRAQKDHPNLLRAIRAARNAGLVARWVVVGQGPLEHEIRSLATELGVADVVAFTGYRSDATSVMAAFDMFTLASSWEGLPVAMMDALALELPVVATAVGGVAEALTDGIDALLVPSGDAVALATTWRRVVDDPALRTALSRAAAQRALAFDARAAVATIERSYAPLADPVATAPATQIAPTRSSPTVSRRAPGYDIRPSTIDDRPAILDLLRQSMQRADDARFADLYAWKHEHNPFGPSPTWVAVHDDRVVGVRAFMRWEFERGGEVVRAVRAVDTATHPDHQGKGLFTALTMHALDELRSAPVDERASFVFNTPNSQSLPGYQNMGWRIVGRLPVAIRPTGPAGMARMARSRVAADHWSLPLDVGQSFDDWAAQHVTGTRAATAHIRTLTTHSTAAFERWRFAGLAELHYRVVPHDTIVNAAVVVRARRRGPSLELVHAATFGLDARTADSLVATTARRIGADHALRLGRPDLRNGFVALPGGGPLLAWRALTDDGLPPLANWALSMADVELF